MKNLKVSKKLIVSFLIVIVLTVIVGAVGIIGTKIMTGTVDDLANIQGKPIGYLANSMEYFQRLRVQMRNVVLYQGNLEKLNTVESNIAEYKKQFLEYIELYRPTIASDRGHELYDEIMECYDIYTAGIEELFRMSRGEYTREEMVAKMDELSDYGSTGADDISELIQLRISFMDDANDDSATEGAMIIIIIIVIIAVAIVISMLIATYISSLISKPLTVLSTFMKKAGTTGDFSLSSADERVIAEFSKVTDEVGETIAGASSFIKHVTYISGELKTVSSGDLTSNVNLLSNNDIMGVSLNSMIEHLNDMFGSINTSTGQVSQGANQIADSAQSLSQGSTEQAASIEELSSSISEISTQTHENAQMAERASSLSENIKNNADKGNRQMNEMMEAVKDINLASQNISKVIKVIDDIAFQTNILALNAAVEAARAGQHGKGFAVVAEEVRNLAAKSAEAAKETSDMIQNSMEKAELGSRIASETAVSFTEISSGINESTELIEDIARSSKDQSMAISQINVGIDQVAKVVQQNSATAEESAAASQEMSGQSTMLQEMVSNFKLK